MSASLRRVAGALRERELDAEVRELPDSTRTAPEAAAALGCEVAQIVKSLVFRGERSGDPVLVLASGADRLDEGLLPRRWGSRSGKADPDFVRRAPDSRSAAFASRPRAADRDVRGGTVARARSGVGSRGHAAGGVRPGVARRVAR